METKIYTDVYREQSFDPALNDKAISIILQPDGNYIGYMNKFNKIIEVRQGDPQVVLQMLLTHE